MTIGWNSLSPQDVESGRRFRVPLIQSNSVPIERSALGEGLGGPLVSLLLPL